MRTWLREVTGPAGFDLTLAWLALLGFLVVGCTARGEPAVEATATAALALAKAKRDREALACVTDLAVASETARRTGRPLVLWVGTTCADHAPLRRALADAVHCHLPEHRQDRTPRVVIQAADGAEWFVRAERIGPDTASRIRDKWAGSPVRRPGVGIREE